MNLSLKTRLIISYSLLSIMLIASLLFIANHVLEYQFKSYVQKKQESVNHQLAAAVLDAFEKDGAPSQDFMKSLAEKALDDGIILMVDDAEGRQIFCMSCVDAPSCENMIGMMRQTMRKRYPDWQGEYTERTYPLEIESKRYGTVTLGYFGPFFYTTDDVAFMNRINLFLGGAALLFLLIAIVMGVFMANRISLPIKRVIDRAREIGKNRYDERIDYSSNIPELRQLIDSVNALAETLESQQKLKKRMARDYAHEFRTPLTALQSNLEGMIDQIFPPTAERLESCRAEILRLARMTDQIGKIAELEHDALRLHKEEFDFGALLAKTAAAFERDLHDKNIAFTLDAPVCFLRADKDKMSQIIVNLLSNAVKYVGEGGRVRAQIKETEDRVVFSVSDDGLGISGEDLPNIFEYLYRTDCSRARDTGGSGIGLSVAKAIVEAHGGKIEAASKPGEGSVFTATLPKI